MVLAQHYNVSEATIRKWRARDDFHDRPHTAHRLQTMVVRNFIHEGMSRSAYRVLVRHGVFRQPVAACDKPGHKPFKTCKPGFVHVDVKYLPQAEAISSWPSTAPPAG